MPVINAIRTGERITKFQKAAGLTVRDLQGIFGFGTPNAIYKWKNGASVPTVDNLIILAAVFGCKVDDLIVVDVIGNDLNAKIA